VLAGLLRWLLPVERLKPSDPVGVTIVGTELEAERICEMLKLEQIPAYYSPVGYGRWRRGGGDLGACRIMVPQGLAQRAFEILATPAQI
jgi:hypothetical protein